MTESNNKDNPRDELTTADGRKITAFSTGGESYTVETTEQAARGKAAEVDAAINEIKLNALKSGIRFRKF